jgi:RNA 3'-phosphate cyclase
MLLLTILPICAYAEKPVEVHVIKGGTDVRHAPTINYLKHVLLPTLRKMSLATSLEIHRYGYYPKGLGEVTLTAHPQRNLSSLKLAEYGELDRLHGVSVCTFLKDRNVADRQAEAAGKYLKARGIQAEIEVVYDESNPLQKGSSLVLWAETDKGALLGGDAIGELRKSSEAVGREAATNILKEVASKATVDVHLADMLVPYIALAKGESVYRTHSMTEHLDTNIWFTQLILGTKFTIEQGKGLYSIRSRGR